MGKKVSLQYLSLIHYRESLFSELFSSKEIDFSIICGKSSPYENMKNYELLNSEAISYISNVKILNSNFIIQKGLLSATKTIDPDIIIMLGVNPYIVSSLYSYLYFKFIKKKKIIWWGHGTLGNQGFLGRKLRLLFFKKCDGILVYGERGRSNLVKNGICSRKIFVVKNCINSSDYGDIRTKLSIKSKGKLSLLFSGRLTKHKKVDEIIKVVRILIDEGYDVVLNVIGNGPEFDSLKLLVKLLRLTKYVSFQGAIYGEELKKYFYEANLYVHPGPIGLSIIHSLSYGIPVIVGDYKKENKPEVEVLVDGFNGSFYEANNINDLVSKIKFWHYSNAVNRNIIIENCMKSIELYKPKCVAKNILDSIKMIDAGEFN